MNSGPQQPMESFSTWMRQRTVQYAAAAFAGGFIFPVVAAALAMPQHGMSFTFANIFAVQRLDPVLWITDTAPIFLAILAGVAGRREDQHLESNRLLRARETELNSIRQNLEDAVAERARQLDQRNMQMRSVVTFARQAADIRDLPTLLSTSVRMISERFDRCDVDLYLLDENRQWAMLRASSTASGAELLKNGYRVAANDQTTVGRVARRGALLVAPVRPETAGEPAAPLTETALPLAVRGKIIGVLSVRSREGMQSDPEILQLLADQLAASIENARLVSESRSTVEQLESSGTRSARAAWQQFLKRNAIAYQLTPSGIRPTAGFSANGTSGGLRLPLKLRGQEIGSIAVKRSSAEAWTEAERDLMEKLAAQVALAVENARLIEETRQRAAQEQIISEVSARFSRSLDVEALLQAAVREFAALPEVAEATVLLKPTGENDSQGQN